MRKIIISIILIIILIALIAVAGFWIVDIETKVPKEVETSFDLKVEEFVGRKVFVISPKEEKVDKYIMYLHGGSYVAETSKDHWEFIEKLVEDTKSTVILPDYPLAPKYTYKDVFTMIAPLYKEIIEKIDKNNLILMGDSAGGGMSLALLEKLADENVEMPSKTILISPWLDVRLENPEIDEVQKQDKELNKETLKLAGIAYAGQDGINNYLVNPIDGDLSKLENITILTGTNDILNPDVHILKQRAKEQGTDIEIKEYNGAGHIWMIENNSGEELDKKGYQDILNLINN